MNPGTLNPGFFFQAEDGIRDLTVTGVQTCALPIFLQKLNYPGADPQPSLVDPQCGSGTFLIAALRRAYAAKRMSCNEWHAFLSDGISGFDVDPVATIAAKTNLLMFVSWLISTGRYRLEKPLRLPMFCADTIYSKQKPTELFDYVVGNPQIGRAHV